MMHPQNSLSLCWLIAKALLKPQALPALSPGLSLQSPADSLPPCHPAATQPPPMALRLPRLMSHHALDGRERGLFCTDLTTSHSSHVHAGSKKVKGC